MRAKRLTKIKDKKAEQYENQWDWKLLVPSTANGSNLSLGTHQLFVANPSSKRKSTPLDILGTNNSCDGKNVSFPNFLFYFFTLRITTL